MNELVESRGSAFRTTVDFHGARRPSRPPAPPKTVALVDWSFWGWLHPQLTEWVDNPVSEEGAGKSVEVAASQLAACSAEIEWALRQAPAFSRLNRVLCYWGRDKKGPLVNGVSLRLVNPEEFDGGLSRLRMMAADLRSIAAQGQIERVLLVADDDRLTLLVDELQRSGIAVDVWSDAADSQSALTEDSSWLRLQGLADQRVVAIKGADPAHFISNESGQIVCDSQDQAVIAAEVAKWWESIDSDEQARWIKEIGDSKSVPSVLDREMLLRVRQQFGGILSLPQKLAMRNAIRDVVLSASATEGEEEQQPDENAWALRL